MKNFFILQMLLILTALGVPAQSAVNPSRGIFYISPNGKDSNSGTSPSDPFRSFERAQSAMQHSSADKKIAYVMGGVYQLSAGLRLTPKDEGESWLGYPGQTPILDGGNAVEKAISINGKNITIRWLTIQNFTHMGIFSQSSQNILIDSEAIKNIKGNGWNQGGIVTFNNFENGIISHNRIENSGYAGIMCATSASDDISNLKIDSNVVYNTCFRVNDCGGIYADDRGHRSKNITISNNIIGNYGNKSTPWAKAIYLDDHLSNTIVKNNIVFGSGGNWAIQFHGGNHNTVENNIFDISGAGTLGIYQDDGRNVINHGMTGNVFACNIVYSSAVPPSVLWRFSKTVELPDVNDNLYWDTQGAMPNSGDIVDRHPIFLDPQFVNPGQGNYNLTDPSMMEKLEFCHDFKPIDVRHVGPLPNLKEKA